jgi:hypothetical protein
MVLEISLTILSIYRYTENCIHKVNAVEFNEMEDFWILPRCKKVKKNTFTYGVTEKVNTDSLFASSPYSAILPFPLEKRRLQRRWENIKPMARAVSLKHRKKTRERHSRRLQRKYTGGCCDFCQQMTIKENRRVAASWRTWCSLYGTVSGPTGSRCNTGGCVMAHLV